MLLIFKNIFFLLKDSISFYLTFLAMLCGMWDLSSLTRDRTCTPALEVQSLNHWTSRDIPEITFSSYFFLTYFFSAPLNGLPASEGRDPVLFSAGSSALFRPGPSIYLYLTNTY